jgi:methionyl aminopeptidase
MIRIKNQRQIDGIRQSCKALARLYKALVPIVREGITTGDLDDFCVDFIKKAGGVPAWYSQDFPGAACISLTKRSFTAYRRSPARSGAVTWSPSTLELTRGLHKRLGHYRRGRGAKRRGERPDGNDQKMPRGRNQGLQGGNRVGDISRAVYDVARQAGYGVVWEYCGHGVGLSVHEDPQIPNVPERGPNPRIVPGMVLAIEPMINMGTGDVKLLDDGWTVVTADGLPSCHMEHTVAVFPDHTEVLTVLTPGED